MVFEGASEKGQPFALFLRKAGCFIFRFPSFVEQEFFRVLMRGEGPRDEEE